MKIVIGCDHAGYELKEIVKNWLIIRGDVVSDVGTFSGDRVDYPDFGHDAAMQVLNEKVDLGIVICGSGNGIAMTANKHQGIRCGLAWNAEVAALARQHNNANMLALPARFLEVEEALDITKAFLEAHFEGGRHAGRVEKINSKS